MYSFATRRESVEQNQTGVLNTFPFIFYFPKRRSLLNKQTMTTATIDHEGRCPCHPFVQLSRISPRTGKWKALLDSCPLCVMDSKSTSQRCNEEKDEGEQFVASVSNTTATTGARQRGRNPMPPPPPRRSRSSSSCGSRVRFQPDKDVQFTTTNSVTRAKSVLRSSPRYKVCEELMQQQLDESVKVPTMSMDMSMDFSHDEEGSRSSFNHSHNEEKHDEQKDQHEKDKEQQKVEDVKEDEDLLPALSPPSLPHINEDDIKETSTRSQDDKKIECTDGSQRRQEWDDGSKSGSRGRRSYQQVKAVLHRPDPEEFLRDDISGCGSQKSNQDYRMQQRSSPSQHRQPLSFSHHHQGEHHPQRPQHNASSALPGTSTMNNHHHNHRQQQPLYTNMVINSVPNDDEVSALTFMGHSSRSTSEYPNCHRTSICENSSQDEDDYNAEVADKAKLSLSMMITNTSDYDTKTGRCIHHPHVRLRKKKLFGKGWKVLMSACPDCCVGELRRIRVAEENNLKRTFEKRKSIDSSSRRSSNHTCDSGDVDNKSTYSSEGSKSGGRGNEGETSASRKVTNSRSSSFQSGPTSFVTDPKTKVTPMSSTKMTVLPPPRRSPSQHRGSLPLPPKKDKMHIEQDETTASPSVSSSGSIENAAIDNSYRTDVSSFSQEEEERSQVQQEIRGNIHVRQMRWTDPKNGQSGTYTGQVNDLFVPHGSGAMAYDPNPNNDMSGLGVAVVLVKDGEWKDGRFRRNRHRSRGNSVTVKRSSRSFNDVGGEEGGGDRLSSSSGRSRSTGRRNMSHSNGHSQQRQRSSSRTARQVSF